MLSPAERTRIEEEELYRAEVRRKANHARPLRRVLQWTTGLLTLGAFLSAWAVSGDPAAGMLVGLFPGFLFGLTLVNRVA
jgi:hypothetical protein